MSRTTPDTKPMKNTDNISSEFSTESGLVDQSSTSCWTRVTRYLPDCFGRRGNATISAQPLLPPDNVTPLNDNQQPPASYFSRFKRYISAPSFANIPTLARWQWWSAAALTVQSILPAELFYNIFLGYSVVAAVSDFYQGHGWQDHTSLILGTKIAALTTVGLNLIGDLTAVSPAEDAVFAVNLFKDKQYKLQLLTSGVEIHPDTLYLNIANDQLKYVVVSPSEHLVEGQIAVADIAGCELQELLDVTDITPFLPQILAKTKAAGHTQSKLQTPYEKNAAGKYTSTLFSRWKAVPYFALSGVTTIIQQIGFAGLGSTDGISFKELLQSWGINPSSTVTTTAAIYFLGVSLTYYNLFLTRKIAPHAEAIVNNAAWLGNKSWHPIDSLHELAADPFAIVDRFARYLTVLTDVTLNAASRTIMTIYCINTINANGVVNLGERNTIILAYLGALSTTIATYMQRSLTQFQSVDPEAHPAYFNGLGDFALGFLWNARTADALMRAIPIALIPLTTDQVSPEVAAAVAGVIALCNFYVGYCQRQKAEPAAAAPAQAAAAFVDTSTNPLPATTGDQVPTRPSEQLVNAAANQPAWQGNAAMGEAPSLAEMTHGTQKQQATAASRRASAQKVRASTQSNRSSRATREEQEIIELSPVAPHTAIDMTRTSLAAYGSEEVPAAHPAAPVYRAAESLPKTQEKLFEELMETYATTAMERFLVVVNVGARIARSIALFEFIQTVAMMTSLTAGFTQGQIDIAWAIVAAAVARSDYYTFAPNIRGSILTIIAKMALSNSENSPVKSADDSWGTSFTNSRPVLALCSIFTPSSAWSRQDVAKKLDARVAAREAAATLAQAGHDDGQNDDEALISYSA